MNTHTEKTQENKSNVVVNHMPDAQKSGDSTFQFADNRPETNAQRKLQTMANSHSESPIQKQGIEEEELLQGKFKIIQKQGLEEEELMQGKFNTIQKRGLEEEELLQGKFITVQKQGIEEEDLLQGKFESTQNLDNNTGLPDNLKSGIENLSGYSLNDVKVHYNSNKPAQLKAHAYAQGTDIHLGSGQEKHLPHEAWHVVQQKQGRVKPTMQMQGKVNVNDDRGLEKEADVMGAKALQSNKKDVTQMKEKNSIPVVQCEPDPTLRKQNAHDERMEALKIRTDFILAGLNDSGINKKEELGKAVSQKAKAKVESIWKPEKEQSKVKMLFDQIWARLTWEQRWEVFKLGMSAAGTAIWESIKAAAEINLPERSEKSPQDKNEAVGGPTFTDFVTFAYKGVSNIETKHVKALYEVMKEYDEIKEKVEEVQNEILGVAGKAGKKAGEFVGDVMDAQSIAKLITGQQSDWKGTKEQYNALRKEISTNEDFARYGFMLEIMDTIFIKTNQFTLVMSGLMSEGANLEAIEVAKGYRIELKKAEILKLEEAGLDGVVKTIGSGLKKIGSGVSKFVDRLGGAEKSEAPEEEDKSTLLQDRELLASTIKRALANPDWSAVTEGWDFVPRMLVEAVKSEPSTVGTMKKIPKDLGGKEYLTAIKSSAIKAKDGVNGRNPVTDEFYTTLKQMEPEDSNNLKQATKAVEQVESGLKTERSKRDAANKK